MPIMIYNPNPYEIISDFEVEFQMAEQNHPGNGIYDIDIADENGKTVSCQLEQEDSAHGMDWRKKAVFYDKTAISYAIKKYDDAWRRYNELSKINDCATLYTDRYYGDGIGESVNRYRGI